MSEFAKALIERAEDVEPLFDEASGRNEDVRHLYEHHLMSIIAAIKTGEITAPSDALVGYWHYFSQEGPWDLWINFPKLVSGMSILINLLNLKDEADFEAYRRRHSIR
ncbi:hypothetical protein PTKU64_80150 [Paraburkholderia terrae]|uniref:Uncharacterized protein n=1 Tax=Paraburkholderia terrae TaxID=311230 RepID=A0ABM7TZE0_9BURK|nr:hypothetical protein [Paraburkholderia terrae]BCZ84340.1 hypothetical protein PTKU64_80150 [Paraburkholderia terrae]